MSLPRARGLCGSPSAKGVRLPRAGGLCDFPCAGGCAFPGHGVCAAPLPQGGNPQGRGELRDHPPELRMGGAPTTGARVVTGPKGLFGPRRTTGKWVAERAVPRAPSGAAQA
ncbi:hypothetical protein SCOCK_160204 [Actinacidiphila cocklensis]|uniref:Uncharacterized protein n=1 Tax=Actinacidiphila cocklensis TaxID=887465 RepID=A0A9W4DLM9_9ACTN|nr:hypothetical protein SCOCK_160204 [Actinacidiphila cocklensis]